MPNHCSYCQGNHTIRRCDSIMINRYFERIKVAYINIIQQPITETAKKGRFISEMCRRFDARDLKAVGVRYTDVLASANKAIISEYLWHYLVANIQLLDVDDNDDPQWIEVHHDEEPEQPIRWYIDRTPTFVNHTNIFRSAPLSESMQSISDYVPAEDEFLAFDLGPFVPRNLQQEFVGTLKKFHISPILSIMETDEELAAVSCCPICYEDVKLEDTVLLNCNHQFCGECLVQTLTKHGKSSNPCCALCREPMTTFTAKKEETYEQLAEHCNL